jgi:hypothetical protein
MNTPQVLDFSDNEIIVKTDGMYRVIFHGPDTDEIEEVELLTAEEAIAYASSFNACERLRSRWAEPISYVDSYHRKATEDEDERVELRVAKSLHAPKKGKKKSA